MSRKLTNEDIKEKIIKCFGNDFELVSNYVNSKEKVKVLHIKCGNITEILPSNIKNGRTGCSVCSKKKKYTTEEIRKRIQEETDGEYELLDEYVNAHTPVRILHKKCGKINMQTPSNFLNHKKRCIDCQTEYNAIIRTKTHEKYVEDVKSIFGDEYSVLGKYVSNKEKIEIKHNICGHVWKPNAQSLLQGHGCPKCANIIRLTNEEFIKRLYDKWGDKYTPLEEYINADIPIRMRHNECGREWRVSPYHILSSNPTECRYCSQEMKESYIATEYKKVMKEKFNAVMENEFPINTNETTLYPDIVILDKKICIEVDGTQHFKYTNLFYKNKEEFNKRIKLDRVKDDWFIKNEFKVIRVGVGVVRNREKELETIDYVVNLINNNKVKEGVTFINYPNKKTWRVDKNE